MLTRLSILGILAGMALAVSACGDDGAIPGADCEEGTIETDSGLRYEEVECGEGDQAGRGSVVTVEYAVAVEGDDPFDSGTLPPFQLGTGAVVAGFDEGVSGMREGGQRRLVVPPDLHYGPEGRPPEIPPDTNLVFDVELLEVQSD